MSLRSCLFGLLAFALCLAAGTTVAGSIAHHTFTSETLGRTYAYNVYLPDNYGTSGLSYPVLYLLHGSNGDENDWPVNGGLLQTADRLMAKGAVPPAIIVMPGSKSWWIDGHNEKAETAFFEDLIPHIEANWRTISGRQGRVLAGLSAGGYGTINFILEHPDMFAAGAALSPASYLPYPPSSSSAYQHAAYLRADGTFDKNLWDEVNYTQYIDAYKAQSIVVPLYINSGDHDKYDIAYHAAVLYQTLREHQPTSVEFRVIDGNHDWKVWAKTLPEAMIYVFGYASGPIGALASQSRKMHLLAQ